MLACKVVMFLVVALTMGSAAAAGQQKAPVQVADSAPVPEQLARVESLLQHEAYAEIGPQGRQRVLSALSAIRRIMGDRQWTTELDLHDRSEVRTQQEIINTVMAQAHEDSRLICQRERITGSKMPVQVCLTVAQRRMGRENGNKWLRDIPFTPPKMQGDP